MTVLEILLILLIHWIADFVLQTDKQAKNKSTNVYELVAHTLTYSLVFFMCGLAYCYFTKTELIYSFYFYIITFVCHTITDYFTSKLNSKLWKQEKTHEFFVSVGFDQVLHYCQLFITYSFLKSL